MFNMVKELYDDYQEMVVKPEKEFYQKHLVGVVLVNLVPITVLLMVPTICISVFQIKNKILTKYDKKDTEF